MNISKRGNILLNRYFSGIYNLDTCTELVTKSHFTVCDEKQIFNGVIYLKLK